jgi:hypothetical protein
MQMQKQLHPITGKEVRIIETSASICMRKTLSYGSNYPFDTVSEDGSHTYRLVLKPTSDDELKAISSSCQIMVLSKGALKGVAQFKSLGIKNVLYLQEIHSIYPHLGGAWDGTAEDAVVLLAGLLRYARICGIQETSRSRALGIEVLHREKPMRLWWVTQFYKPSNGVNAKADRRLRELKKCLAINSASPLIDKIVLLNEKRQAQDFVKSDKIEEVVIGERLTYARVFEKISEFPDDVIVAFANADICIDDSSWKHLWNVDLTDKCLALLRYDVPSSDNIKDAEIFGPRSDSQDTWVVRAADVKSRQWTNVDYKFGEMGCDNAIAFEMMRQKFLVVNPAQTIKTWHFHSSEVRNYNKADMVLQHMLHYIKPSPIHDLMPVLKWSSNSVSCGLKRFTPAPMNRSLRGSGLDAWLKVSAKANAKAKESLAPEEVILELTDCFQTSEGLVFDKKNMYVGESAKAVEKWGSATIHSMMPTLDSEKMLIAPWPADAEKSREKYCIYYLSKIFRLWDLYGGGDFFGCDTQSYHECLELFRWDTEVLPVISRDDEALIWGKKGYGFPLTDLPLVSEDIDALRGHLSGWQASATQKNRIVIVQDGILLKDDLVYKIEDALEAHGWKVNVLTKGNSIATVRSRMMGATGVVCSGSISSFGWNWMLPRGAAVFEVNAVTSEGLDLSAAAGLEHFFLNIIGKPEEKQVAVIVDEVLGFSPSPSSREDQGKPTIWMPRSDLEGYFGHPGDSFREMVRLWEKAGYVNVKTHSGMMVWWGEVGAKGVLLYDRPTNEWRMAAPMEERQWKKALFGNPVPSPSSAHASVPWFFWPRRPELVEELVSTKGYDARSQGPVFYGKVENMVQASRRKLEWKDACEEWILVKGDEAYPFTQKEYLERLSGWRFGLCMAGYGKKCHREIECMAMGCVPVVTPEVDMDSYANPPICGIHYLRAKIPEEVAGLLAMSKEAWEKMSLAGQTWWKENASCKGSFELTRGLVE